MFVLFQIALVIGLLLLSLWIGYTLLQILLPQLELHPPYIFFLSLLLGQIVPNLIMAQANYFLEIPINRLNLILVWLTLGITLRLIRTYLKMGPYFPRIGGSWAGLTLGIALIPIVFQWSHFTISGGDAPIYLYRLAYTISTGNLYEYLDRGIFYVMPLSFHWLAGVDLEASLRISHVIVFTLSSLGVGLLTYALTQRTWISFWAVITTVLSVGHVLFTLDFFIANRLGIVVTTFIVILLSYLSQKKLPTPRPLILVTLLWASLFNIHGLVAFASLIVIGLPVVIYVITLVWTKSLFSKELISTVIVSLIIGLLVTQPLLTKYFHSFTQNALQPIWTVTQETILSPATANPVSNTVSDQNIEAPANKAWFHNSEKFSKYFGNSVLYLAVGGLMALIYQLRWNKRVRLTYILVLIAGLNMFLVSQQQVFGINLLVDRFIRGQYPFIISFAAVGLTALEKLLASAGTKVLTYVSKTIGILILVSLFFPWYDLASKAYNPPISPHRYVFFSTIPDYVDQQTPIFTTEIYSNWLLGLNPKHQIVKTPYPLICTLTPPQDALETLPPKTQLALAFSQYVTVAESIKILKENAQNDTYAVVIDLTNNCVNQNLFLTTDYHLVQQTRLFKLLIKK